MNDMTRREFAAGSAAAVPGVMLAAGWADAAAVKRMKMGAQSFSFRNFGLDESIERLKGLGLDTMEFCKKHFPADASDSGFAQVKATIKKEGIGTPSFGVMGFKDDFAANRKVFEFGKALGVEVLTANPTAEALDNIEELTEEFDIKIAIHNHGPKALYSVAEDTLDAVKGRSPMIGACVDTGHAIRSGEKPHEVIDKLGERVLAVHLKDWVQDGEEVIPGEGDMDLLKVAKALVALAFRGPLMLEYENEPDNPNPGMEAGLKNWYEAVKQA